MKKLMIMGAGIYQVPLIKKAKEMGIYTIAVSIPGNYPGFALADKVIYENTVDYERILEVAKEEKIDGIVTAGTDVAVITIGKVCDELGLAGISFEAAKIASNKILMKRKYEEYGVRTARFREIGFDEDLKEKIQGLNFPMIVKAVDSSGSRGITRVNAEAEFEAAVEAVKSVTRTDHFIVEEFIEGKEFGAQAFVQNGKLKFALPHGDYVFQGDTGVPIGHFAPYELSEEVINDAEEQLEKAIQAMGLNNCAINADFILKDDKTYVLELGGRSGATCLAELVSIYYGYDYYEKLIRAALGEFYHLSIWTLLPVVAVLIFSILRMEVKRTLAISALVGIFVAVLVQKYPVSGLPSLCISGFSPDNEQINRLMGGGGVLSNMKVVAIVGISSCYSGIFKGTDFLHGIKEFIGNLNSRITPFGTTLLTSVVTAAVSCNQTLSIMLTNQLCGENNPDKKEFALSLENSAVVVAPLIPWSIASAVPLAFIGAPTMSVCAAIYLYLLPACYFFSRHNKRKC